MISKIFRTLQKNTNSQVVSRTLTNKYFSSCTKTTTACSSSAGDSFTPPAPKNFKLEQIWTGCLSEFAYYIESNGEAVIIDPLRDTNAYIELAKKNNAKIKYVLETHFHADFVSGHLELANKTGATIVYGPQAEAKYNIHVAKDGEILKVGNLKIKVLHTPGHTMESSCFLLIDEDGKYHSLFSGDTVFLGEVGRPDLAVKGELITKEDLAGLLYDSIHKKILPLPDDVLVYPGHGAGSPCGKSISKGKVDTLGRQRKLNYALQPMTKEQFVKVVASDLPTPPKYFFKDAAINKEGYKGLDEVLAKMKALSYKEFAYELENGSTILDCRETKDFEEGHIPGSIHVSLSLPFAMWVAALVEFNSKVVVVAETGKESEALIRLARVGYDNVYGFLQGGVETWEDNGGKLETVNIIKPSEFKEKLAQRINIVDVRNPPEWETGVVKNAKLIPMGELAGRLNELDKSQTYYLYCKSGVRSQVAYSLLKANGFKNLFAVEGGFDRIISEGVELAPSK